MALTFAGTVLSGSVTLKDFGGQTIPVNYRLVTTDPTQGITDIQAIANTLKAATSLQVDRVSINIAYETIGDDAVGVLNSTPAFGAEREHYSVFEVLLSDDRTTKLMVPGPIEAILNTSKPDYIEVANTLVQDYISIFQSTGDNLATIGTASVVGDPTKAYTRHKESRTKVERTKLG